MAVPDGRLSHRQRAFIDAYMVSHNALKAYREAGYKAKSDTSAETTASEILRNPNVAAEIRKRQEESKKSSIATAQEVMEYFTRVMNGEILDQFGLEAPLSERTRAAMELAKRTVDLENKLNGKNEPEIKIVLDWARD